MKGVATPARASLCGAENNKADHASVQREAEDNAGTLTFPARFMFISAMNPCPCGYYGDPARECTCSMTTISRYQKRISGPLLDRVDIHIEVPRVDADSASRKTD